MDEPERLLTRRRLLQLGVALPLPLLVACSSGGDDRHPPAAASSGPLPTTPACDDGDDPTPPTTEGPFFTPDSPETTDLRTAGMAGTALTLTGVVVDQRCRPIARALLDFWQADDAGEYDNDGYRLRGHQFTGADGRYRLETVVPGLYTGRTRHIHLKAQAPGGPVLTSQLFFPGEAANRGDSIFDEDLVVQVRENGGRRQAQFVFVLATG